MKYLLDKLAEAGGKVWCRVCCSTCKVDPIACLARGWPTCCGYTMSIDSPDTPSRRPVQP